ncbi:Lrp/AsnC family transcriptional regulator [Acinetobacter stercoris]|uniref:Leucine-responsive regulatory protein n=1 Tax=Acinetobacter stercoris TaxID=2126983 RepID=A0A2U3MW06_9GAMM|nr:MULTISPECIES: Lrp/AsnC family transcriptional regulator [Acinetobacter]SPL69618.1 Leucine-responsive regulatory protein [Acinetobacter stercoris]
MLNVDLDRFDIKLLEIIQNDARLPQKDLGESVNLSTAAVNRRLKKLSEQGVIESYNTKIKPEALGFNITVITTIKVINEQFNELESLRKLFSSCRQVQQSYYVAGEWDFVLIILVRNMDEYTELTENLFIKNKNIKKFQTLVAMRKDKVSLSVPIEI